MLVTALFFLWGIPNNLNDILIRQFMTSFAVSRFQAGLVQSAFYLGYFLLAMPAALLMRRYGYKSGLVTGLLLYGTGAFLFWPAALVDRYGFFLFALFVIASGLAFLETASNSFIAQLGPPESAARRLNFSQAFNPLGSITAALIGTVFIFSGVELNDQQIATMKARAHLLGLSAPGNHARSGAIHGYWRSGFALGGADRHSRSFPEVAGEHLHEGEAHGSFRELLGYPSFLFAVVAQFMYVGAQVGTWSYFIQYVQDSTHQHEKMAGYLLTGTLAAFGVGRFSSAAIMRYFRPDRLMALYSVANVALVAVGVLFPGWIGLWAIFLTSFFMSVMFPTIFALGIEGLGRNTKIGGSLIIMSIVGGAVLTPLMGWISQATHRISIAYAVPLVCYVVVGAYSLAWHRLRDARRIAGLI